jgi:serine/threonine protein kinase
MTLANDRSDFTEEGREADDPRLTQALQEYLGLLEAGQSVSREEFLKRYPDINAPLSQAMKSLEFVHETSEELPRPEIGSDDLLGDEASFADFRLLREIGRGGMGVVYEAEQVSLGRRVALKVLPLAATFDPRQLARFKSEARIAAKLHHTNIIPVYAVGSERGVHYFAMQYVEGHSLSDLIAELRRYCGTSSSNSNGAKRQDSDDMNLDGLATPRPRLEADCSSGATESINGLVTERSTNEVNSFRRLARWAEQAAEAIDYAHLQGIIHRDIKPSNLIVDTNGRLWVTDFGLARVATDNALTVSGDLLGTLRYMSPEQASCDRQEVDYRTDIYSLGVTLYELSTLSCPFEGKNRQELLERISSEEPVPLRRRNPSVPEELETIILKAMAKERSERYATGQALADDLRRFLEDKPIQARRPTAWRRLRKWTKRHRRYLVVAAAMLSLGVVGTTVITFQMVIAAKKSAEEGQRKLRQAVKEMYSEAPEELFAHAPGKQLAQRKFLEKALAYYENLLGKGENGADVRFEYAQVALQLAQVQRRLGDTENEHQLLSKALEFLKGLVQEEPGNANYRYNVARTSFVLGGAIIDQKERERHWQESIGALEGLAVEFPGDPRHRSLLAFVLDSYATRLLLLDRPSLAETYFHRAVALNQKLAEECPEDLKHRRNLARDLHGLSLLCEELGRQSEAESRERQALGIARELVRLPGADFTMEEDLANYQHHLAYRLIERGSLAEVPELLESARAGYQKLARDYPGVPVYKEQLASVSKKLATVCERRGKGTDGARHFDDVGVIYEELVHDYPKVASYKDSLAFWLAFRPNAKPEDLPRALKLAREAVALATDGDVARWTLGIICCRAQLWAEAVSLLESAPPSPIVGDIRSRLFLAIAYAQLGDRAKARAVYEKAAEQRRGRFPQNEELKRLDDEARNALRD